MLLMEEILPHLIGSFYPTSHEKFLHMKGYGNKKRDRALNNETCTRVKHIYEKTIHSSIVLCFACLDGNFLCPWDG